MANDETAKGVIDQKARDDANKWLVDFMQTSLEEGRKEVKTVQQKLKRTYNVIVVLSIIMFAVGIILLLVPVIDGLREALMTGESVNWGSVGVGGLGIADLAALFLFRPIERIHKLMGDMTQITVEVNSYQTQVSLRLLEVDSTQRPTFGKAADFVKEAARNSIETIQKYFEAT